MRFDDLKRGLDAVKYGKTTQLFRLPARSIGKPLGVSVPRLAYIKRQPADCHHHSD
jgi:hypothetical protein